MLKNRDFLPIFVDGHYLKVRMFLLPQPPTKPKESNDDRGINTAKRG